MSGVNIQGALNNIEHRIDVDDLDFRTLGLLIANAANDCRDPLEAIRKDQGAADNVSAPS